MTPIILDQPAPTAGFIFKLGSLDLSSYLRVNPDDKMDPYAQSWIEPAFTETPFADGQPLISTTVHNREQQWPLFLKDSTRLKDQLHALIQSINVAAAARPLMVEWRDSGATFSTFYDVQFVRFEPDFNFRRSVHGYAAGILHVWTTGYGHTGTTRVAATAAGAGIFLSVPIGSVAGDAPALMDTTITAGANLPSLGRIVALAPIVNPSYTPQIPAASLTDLQPGAVVIGASGADGSQYLALPISPTGGASGVACKVPLPNPTIAGGDNRILGVVKSGIDAGVGLTVLDPYGNVIGPTAVASMSQTWGLVDLGVCRMPTTGYPTLPKLSVVAGAIWASGASPPRIIASPAGLALNEVLCLPDKNLTLILEAAGRGSTISKDAFARTGGIDGQNDDLGNPWSDSWNNVGLATSILNEQNGLICLLSGQGLYPPGDQKATVAASSIDSAQLAGILTDSMLISAKPLLQGGEVGLIKNVASGAFVQARLNFDTYFLDLSAATNGALNLLASVAASTPLVLPAKLRLSLQLQGGQALVNLTRDDGGALLVAGASSAFASLGASSAAISGGGLPGISINQGANSRPNPGAGAVYAWEVDSIPSSNLLQYDSYRIDGPNADSYRTSSAGVFAGQKLVGNQRGAFPKMVPSTTSVAVIVAPFDQGSAQDSLSAAVSVRERFTYAR